MANEDLTISTVSIDRYYKNLFTMICDRYDSSASATLRDFMENYCKIHYVEFMDDPIFAEATISYSPERDFSGFVREVFRLQTDFLTNKYKNTGSRMMNTLKTRETATSNIDTLFEPEGD